MDTNVHGTHFEQQPETPMKCPKCGFEAIEQGIECQKCGIVFSKLNKIRKPGAETDFNVHEDTPAKPRSAGQTVTDLFFDIKFETNPFLFGGRLLFLIVLTVWGTVLVSASIESNYTGQSFWHLVNLPFHEAGHVVFRVFGSRIIHSMGGSLGQLLMPVICFAVFLLKTRDQFAASFSIWWLGENFVDMSPYINDARSLSLPLLGGNVGYSSPYGFHDWEFILTELGITRYDHILAESSRGLGAFLMAVSFAWCVYILCKQFKYLR